MNQQQVTDQLTNAELEVLYFLGEEHRVSPNYVEEHTTVSSQHAGNILRDLAGHGVTTKLTHGLYDLNTPEEITAGTPVAEAARAFLLDEFDTQELEPEDILANELQTSEDEHEDDTEPSQTPTPTTPQDLEDVPGVVDNEIEDVILHWKVGRGRDDRAERRDIGRAALKHLYQHGSAEKDDFVTNLYDEHSLDHGQDTWWKDMIRDLLNTARQKGLVEKPGRYTYKWNGSE